MDTKGTADFFLGVSYFRMVAIPLGLTDPRFHSIRQQEHTVLEWVR